MSMLVIFKVDLRLAVNEHSMHVSSSILENSYSPLYVWKLQGLFLGVLLLLPLEFCCTYSTCAFVEALGYGLLREPW
jgi:hypothetical protein